MKANELRIGNLVIHEQTTHIIKNVLENTCVSDWVEAKEVDNYTHNYNEIKPIPLTEEWLFKFGFKDNNFCYEFEEHEIKILEDGTYIYWVDSGYICSFKYVHQLQNLYFALTQKELRCLN